MQMHTHTYTHSYLLYISINNLATWLSAAPKHQKSVADLRVFCFLLQPWSTGRQSINAAGSIVARPWYFYDGSGADWCSSTRFWSHLLFVYAASVWRKCGTAKTFGLCIYVPQPTTRILWALPRMFREESSCKCLNILKWTTAVWLSRVMSDLFWVDKSQLPIARLLFKQAYLRTD